MALNRDATKMLFFSEFRPCLCQPRSWQSVSSATFPAPLPGNNIPDGSLQFYTLHKYASSWHWLLCPFLREVFCSDTRHREPGSEHGGRLGTWDSFLLHPSPTPIHLAPLVSQVTILWGSKTSQSRTLTSVLTASSEGLIRTTVSKMSLR